MRFRLLTFGGLSLAGDSGPVTGSAAQRRKLALLAVLAAGGERGVSRDRLLTLFWSEIDAERARHRLTQMLSALRHDLGADELFLGTTELRLNPAIVASDVSDFEAARTRNDLDGAVALYAGPFLDAVHLDHANESPEFERWVEAERARLAGLLAEALERLAQRAGAQGDSAAAIAWWRRLAALDPYNSRFVTELMTALVRAGDPAGALRQAQVYATLLRTDLDIAPDETVTAIIERIRSGIGRAPAPVRLPAVARTEPPATQPPVSTSSTGGARGLWMPVGIGLALIALAAIVLFTLTRRRATLEPNLIAVAPFDVLDMRFALWHEGLVDYLSRSLDGAGPVRTVSPTVVLRGWNGPADRTSAGALARRTGARLVVFGQVIGAGADSVRLRMTVLDAATGRALAEPERADVADRIDRLADSLTTDVLRSLGRAGSVIGAGIALPSVSTRSLSALKAFLQGEQLLRRFSLDSAITAYELAVADDSGFALALHHLGLVRGWRGENGELLGLKAGRLNHHLGARDSLLIVADSLEAAADDSLDGAYWTHRVRKLAVLQEAARRYPDDPEVWYDLGEARFHLGFVVGATAQQTIDAFNRAIALDATFAPAYFHLVQLALDRNDTAAAKRYIAGYTRLTSDVPEGAGIRLVGQLIDPSRAQSAALQAALDTASANVLFDAWRSVQRWPDEGETGVRLLRVLAAGHRGTGVAADTLWVRYLLATELLYRGHLREARRRLGSRFSVPFAELAAIGVVPPDSAAAAFRDWLRHAGKEVVAADPRWVSPCYSSFLAAGWWLRESDTLSLIRLMHRGDSVARSVRGVVPLVDARSDASVARAALALARRDTAEALRRFLSFPDSLCSGHYGSLSPSLAPLLMMRFELLAAMTRDREAARVFDEQVTVPLSAASVVATLDRARIAERLGDRARAAQNYQYVVAVWRNADPELRGYVAEAHAGLARLGVESRR